MATVSSWRFTPVSTEKRTKKREGGRREREREDEMEGQREENRSGEKGNGQHSGSRRKTQGYIISDAAGETRMAIF